MAKSKPSGGSSRDTGATDGPITTQSERGKAFRIRAQLAKGKPVEAERLEWLAEYDARLAAAKGADPDPDPAPAADAEQTELPLETAPEPDPAPAPEPELEAPPPPAPPRAPRVDAHGQGAAAAGDWRAKYRRGKSGEVQADGREQVCTYVADAYVGILEIMAGQLKDIGVDPLIEPSAIRSMVVLACDNLLPQEVAITPEAVVAIGTGATLFQRLKHGKAIAEHEQGKVMRERVNRMRSAAPVEPPPAPAPSSPPPPPPAPTPSSSSPPAAPQTIEVVDQAEEMRLAKIAEAFATPTNYRNT